MGTWVNDFKSLDEQTQRKVLGALSPEAKQRLLEGLKGGASETATAEELVEGGGTPRLLRHAGFSEPPPPPSFAEKAVEHLPMLGGAVGGVVGNVPGAIAGGMGGEAMRRTLKTQESIGRGDVEPPSASAAMDIGLEGIKQGGYELGGRILSALVGVGAKAIAGKIEQPTETIAGVTMPLSAGQSAGKTGGLMQKVEHYLSGTFLGGPLRKVRDLQEEGARQIMAKLSEVGVKSPNTPAANWAMARETTKQIATPIYDSFREVAATPPVRKVAQDILADEGLALGSKVKRSLNALVGESGGMNFKDLGYGSREEMLRKLGPATVESMEKAAGVRPTSSTIREAIDARHELGSLASGTRDASEARKYWEAYASLDEAINASLTPEQLAAKKQADLLWRRSYIMDEIARNFEKMENVQDPNATPRILVGSFVKMVNKMARSPITRAEGEIVTKPSKLGVLFDNPADAKAMKDLASFMVQKYSTLKGAAGIGESIANIGTAVEAVRIPEQLVSGNIGSAVGGAKYLTGLFLLSKILAEPGGAILAKEYFMSPAARQIALLGRIGSMMNKESTPKSAPASPSTFRPVPLAPWVAIPPPPP